MNAGKKTIAPADVFKALEDTEFSFLRAPLEAEFASTYAPEPRRIRYILLSTACHFPLILTISSIFVNPTCLQLTYFRIQRYSN